MRRDQDETLFPKQACPLMVSRLRTSLALFRGVARSIPSVWTALRSAFVSFLFVDPSKALKMDAVLVSAVTRVVGCVTRTVRCLFEVMLQSRTLHFGHCKQGGAISSYEHESHIRQPNRPRAYTFTYRFALPLSWATDNVYLAPPVRVPNTSCNSVPLRNDLLAFPNNAVQ